MLEKFKKFIENFYGKKLANQLIITYISIFLIVVAISSILIYTWIVNILKNNSEKNSVQQFKQSQYNIESFCNGVDLLSRQLVVDAELQNYSGYIDKSDSERIMIAAKILNKFSIIISNFRYIDSILYYGGDGLILKASYKKSEVAFTENSKKDWFYTSDFFREAKKEKMRLVWSGGYTDKDFEISEDKNANQNQIQQYYMSAARTIFTGNMVSTLVININVHEFTPVYNNSNDSENNERYVINNMGKVISHPDNLKIGTVSKSYNGLKDRWNNKDITTITERYQDKQIVYYRLPISDWTLVDEVPIKVITKDILGLRNIVVFIFLTSLVLAAALSRYRIYRITRPLTNLTMVMRKMEQGNLGLTMEVKEKNEIGVLVEQFNKMSTSIKELVQLNDVIQEDKRNIEMEALRAQINPHFIYNTLNMIKWMAIINKADNIVDSLTTLSDFLSPIFKKNSIICSIEEEVEYIRNYIKIMNYRFAGGFRTYINIPEEMLSLDILRFILQPVVENAITHGLI